ncbi:MAG: two-component system, OmpR family, response regulator QseB [Pseudomonadota bacterium]|nr:two-component system, OmpR family, response regulator QseB [Pseudomonadota bacterium]
MRLLLVEDDALLGDGIRNGLKQQDFAVEWLRDGESAVQGLLHEHYDAVVLDLGLPKKHGLDVLREIRSKGKTLPVLILTAQDAVEDRVAGLDAGADDYLIKPFDLDELYARIRALLRRAAGRAEPKIVYGEIEIDPAAHQVTLAGKPVELSRREYSVLLELMQNRGRVMSRSRLEEGLYEWGEQVESNTVEVHVHHLRKKLGSNLIRTMRGVGYMIDK